jgi:hypothetical protein
VAHCLPAHSGQQGGLHVPLEQAPEWHTQALETSDKDSGTAAKEPTGFLGSLLEVLKNQTIESLEEK